MGYLGGVVAFIIFLAAELTDGFGGLLSDAGIARFSFILAAVWWIIFAWPLLRHGHQRYSVGTVTHPLLDSLKRIKTTLQHINQYRRLTWFLVAYFFYIDGVDTIFMMATAIGKDLGIKTTMLMMILLAVQLIAFPCSILYGWLVPKNASSEFFGFYNILGKFSVIMGPFIVGLVTQWTGKSTIGAASLSMLFGIGFVIFTVTSASEK